MEEKIDVSTMKEMVSILKDIRERLSVPSSWGSIRGPVADPATPWRGPIADPIPPWRGPIADPIPPMSHMRMSGIEAAPSWNRLGIVADPGPEILGREKLAKLKIREIEMIISDLEKQTEFLKLQRDLLAEEYKI